MDFANTAVRDDTIVRKGGKGPSLVHLHDTNYPSCRRVTMGACYKTLPNDQAVLAGYSQNYCPTGCAAAPPRRTAPRRAAPHRAAPRRTAPHRTRLNPTTRPNPFHALHSALRLTSMRHMPPFIAKIGEALWRAAYDKLPELCQQRLPNVCVMQTYSRRRGDFMDYHTDSRQTYAGQKIALVSPTVLLALVLVLSALSCLREHPPYGPEPHTKQRKRVQAVGNPPGAPAVVIRKCHTVLRRDHGTKKNNT